MTDADLNKPTEACPPDLKAVLGTNAGCFLIMIANMLTHRGQVADTRRAAGRLSCSTGL